MYRNVPTRVRRAAASAYLCDTSKYSNKNVQAQSWKETHASIDKV